MLVIRKPDGTILSQSANLRGIRREVGRNIVKVVAIDKIGAGEGKLAILFDNGNSFETNFASYGMLCWSVRLWRNLYGAPLIVCGTPSGLVSSRNPTLPPTT